jgi:hypothetical protein
MDRYGCGCSHAISGAECSEPPYSTDVYNQSLDSYFLGSNHFQREAVQKEALIGYKVLSETNAPIFIYALQHRAYNSLQNLDCAW